MYPAKVTPRNSNGLQTLRYLELRLNLHYRPWESRNLTVIVPFCFLLFHHGPLGESNARSGGQARWSEREHGTSKFKTHWYDTSCTCTSISVPFHCYGIHQNPVSEVSLAVHTPARGSADLTCRSIVLATSPDQHGESRSQDNQFVSTQTAIHIP